jgi:hypothetical protein
MSETTQPEQAPETPVPAVTGVQEQKKPLHQRLSEMEDEVRGMQQSGNNAMAIYLQNAAAHAKRLGF